MRLSLPCCCFIPAWLVLHGVAYQSVLLCAQSERPCPSRGTQCSSGASWYLLWGKSGCAGPSLGLGGQQQVRQEWSL